MKRVIMTPKMRTVDQNKFVSTVSSIVSPNITASVQIGAKTTELFHFISDHLDFRCFPVATPGSHSAVCCGMVSQKGVKRNTDA